MKTDILTVPTVTIALKAKKALSRRGIKANVIKIDSSVHQSGCSYGIEFPASEFYNVISIMKEAKITYNHLDRGK